jgi:hypothetical protein
LRGFQFQGFTLRREVKSCDAGTTFEEIFNEGDGLARKRLHDTAKELAHKEEKARKRRRLLRVIILIGALAALVLTGSANLLQSDSLAILGFFSGSIAVVAFLCLVFMGGVAKPRRLEELTKCARRRIKA